MQIAIRKYFQPPLNPLLSREGTEGWLIRDEILPSLIKDSRIRGVKGSRPSLNPLLKQGGDRGEEKQIANYRLQNADCKVQSHDYKIQGSKNQRRKF